MELDIYLYRLIKSVLLVNIFLTKKGLNQFFLVRDLLILL